LAAWKFAPWVDVLHVSDDVFAALPEGEALEATPILAISDDGAPEVWLIDGPVKRHVPSPAAFAAWHFDPAAITTRPASELAALPTATPLRARPMVLQASGPALMLVDDPRTPIDPGAGGGGGSTGASTATTSGDGSGAGGDDAGTTDEGCACRGAQGAASRQGARWVLTGLALAALAGRRRRRAA
jgi:MYXO-CTERM domain-containing protein